MPTIGVEEIAPCHHAPFRQSPGKHKLTFRADGYQSVDRLLDFSLVGGDSVVVDVTLSPTPRATTKKPPKQAPDITTFE